MWQIFVWVFIQCLNIIKFKGVSHDKLNDTVKSIKYHERHLALAEHINDDAAKDVANRHLIEVYKYFVKIYFVLRRKYAEEFEKLGNAKEAVVYYTNCLQSALIVDDLKSEVFIFHSSVPLLYRELLIIN